MDIVRSERFIGWGLLCVVYERFIGWEAFFVVLFVGCSYFVFLCFGLHWWDVGELSVVAHSLGVVYPIGFPVYLFVVKLVSLLFLGLVVFWVNLVSVIVVVLVVGLCYCIIVCLVVVL